MTMKRFVDAIEMIAGLLLLGMAFLTSVSAFTRYIFASPIPDEYEISRLTLGIVACWAIAAVFRHHGHIQLDILWDRTPERAQILLTRIGALVCAVAMVFVAWALGAKVLDSYQSGIVSVDLGLPVWVFHAIAWLGTLGSIVVLAAEVVAPGGVAADTPPE
jgi:TRAP-type C4-dicarboxylate transport system permease small subunit